MGVIVNFEWILFHFIIHFNIPIISLDEKYPKMVCHICKKNFFKSSRYGPISILEFNNYLVKTWPYNQLAQCP